ncbi:RluA family pseudouridine synthase [Lapidilactobacillus luobeiensis]|uniref:RluA family pseudouridine synthase n=1 Tax=Lapidilactobacillus luobeiensis TaxID=2950371 RepID=UPI0021C2ADF6|nr:RluA family pseudouridine synthase [Lapidilactobacillus luobeiensis]
MKKFQITLPPTQPVCSLRELLQHWLIPKKWQHLLRVQEKVQVNGRYRYFNEKVYPGDHLTLDFDFVPLPEQSYQPSAGQLAILYQDTTTVIVNKPAGLKTHPNRPDEVDTVFNILSQQLATPPLMVHRLDQQTSGALLIAMTPVVVPLYNRQLIQKTMGRDYLAWVHDEGDLATQGQIDLPIGADPADKRKRRIDQVAGQSAQTTYQVLQREPHRSLVALQLTTGRTHQLRVHLQALQHPIINDPLYDPQADPQAKMLLHGACLHFTQPFSEELITVAAPLPDYFPRITRA